MYRVVEGYHPSIPYSHTLRYPRHLHHETRPPVSSSDGPLPRTRTRLDPNRVVLARVVSFHVQPSQKLQSPGVPNYQYHTLPSTEYMYKQAISVDKKNACDSKITTRLSNSGNPNSLILLVLSITIVDKVIKPYHAAQITNDAESNINPDLERTGPSTSPPGLMREIFPVLFHLFFFPFSYHRIPSLVM